MAIDAYMTFTPYNGEPLQCESTVNFGAAATGLGKGLTPGQVFEISEWSQLSIEQQLNIGSQSSGTGAGRVDFKEFSITRYIDKASPIFFAMACSGTPFKNVALALRKSSGGMTSGLFFLRFDFKLAAVKTISYSHDETSPKEEVTFEYGGMLLQYCMQGSGGNMGPAIAAGWDRTQNLAKDVDWTVDYAGTGGSKLGP
jgi:type VI secretion system Hcp family effector